MKRDTLQRNVAVIVLNWNGWRNSTVCLESLLPSVRKGHASVIVVDNASTDDSVLRLEQWLGSRDDGFLELQDPEGIVQSPECPSFTLIRASRNGGYAAGNNLGIRFALRFPAIEFMSSKNIVPKYRAFVLRMPLAAGLAVLCLFALVRIKADETQHKNDVTTRQQNAATIIEKNCVECHGGRLTRSGFDITTLDGLLKGGIGGPAIVSGELAKSRLLVSNGP